MVMIQKVEPLQGHWLRLTLTNGDVIERDVGAAIWARSSAPSGQIGPRLAAEATPLA